MITLIAIYLFIFVISWQAFYQYINLKHPKNSAVENCIAAFVCALIWPYVLPLRGILLLLKASERPE